jgi:hypothetical protein
MTFVNLNNGQSMEAFVMMKQVQQAPDFKE